MEVYEQIAKYLISMEERGTEFSVADLQAKIKCQDKMKIRRALIIDLEDIVEEDPQTHLWHEILWQRY